MGIGCHAMHSSDSGRDQMEHIENLHSFVSASDRMLSSAEMTLDACSSQPKLSAVYLWGLTHTEQN